jgi:hypothetical protein
MNTALRTSNSGSILVPEALYKYTKIEFLISGTIRFTPPKELNDPFELFPDTAGQLRLMEKPEDRHWTKPGRRQPFRMTIFCRSYEAGTRSLFGMRMYAGRAKELEYFRCRRHESIFCCGATTPRIFEELP